MSRRRTPVWTPSADQLRHWPAVSGNAINGVGESAPRRPSPVYWRPPDTIPHGPLQRWFYQHTGDDETLAEARRERQRAIDEPLVPINPNQADLAAEALTDEVKRAATDCGADDVGVTPMRAAYVFKGDDPPAYPWMIVLAVEQDYEAMSQAASMRALVEITRQYGRGIRAAKGLANWLRGRGYDGFPTAARWRARSC
jgi:epoxyqueuosine reductase